MSFVGDIVDSITGAKSAGKAAEKGAETSAAAQREAVEYLKEIEAVPRQFREGALQQLGGMFGLGDDSQYRDPYTYQPISVKEITQADIESSPLFNAITSLQPRAEEAVLRQAAATGGLRSGNVQQALANTVGDIQRQAITAGYEDVLQDRQFMQSAAEREREQQLAIDQLNRQYHLAGLQGLAGLQSYAPQIAAGTAGIGQTLGQGQVAAAQAKQAGRGALLGLGSNLGGAFLASDKRLKDNIKKIGEIKGYNLYSWTWNKIAEGMGLSGDSEGFIAQELPGDYVKINDNGYLMVDYRAILS